MFRTLARRGASVLVAAALLGGGLALGGGTASAEEAPGSVGGLASGSFDILNGVVSAPVLLFTDLMKVAAGSSDSDSVTSGQTCSLRQDRDCPFLP
ncbi:hypothetical protein [Rhodococcus maanshanensis]|uniref:Uncharacterized protein n=1 Tax=Rhodococcus maanshanensis TaxID=183556 RepID=A0A1H7W4Q4_9NOCA|nr:hypothetical protein [Rhodococcus maanshanensis]SEM15968.1 hypothetical protein SAMN05444583_12463 [Rhodococcus maanshanensis]